MIYVCVEREGEFGLYLYVCKEMISYFFAGGHWIYARDSIVNLRMSVSALLFSSFKVVFTDVNKLISINNSIVSSHQNVTLSLIDLHALSGYNSVTMMFHIGKSKTLKAVSKITLRYVGDVDANLVDVMREEKQFVAKYYGAKSINWVHLKIDAQYGKTRPLIIMCRKFQSHLL